MQTRHGIPGFIQDFAGLIFPCYCAACGCALYRNENVLCLNCLTGLPRTGFHTNPENEVAQIFWGRVQVMHVTSFIYFIKGSHYQHILHELKYNGQMNVGTHMGRMFGNELKNSAFAVADLIHPVPLHPAKQRKRGYNQSELIARGMADVLHIPVETNLTRRTAETDSQTRKSRYDRWENVRDLFRCGDPVPLHNKHVLLVDDVVTTGATLEAVASCLLGVQGTTVSIATLAFTKLQ